MAIRQPNKITPTLVKRSAVAVVGASPKRDVPMVVAPNVRVQMANGQKASVMPVAAKAVLVRMLVAIVAHRVASDRRAVVTIKSLRLPRLRCHPKLR